MAELKRHMDVLERVLEILTKGRMLPKLKAKTCRYPNP